MKGKKADRPLPTNVDQLRTLIRLAKNCILWTVGSRSSVDTDLILLVNYLNSQSNNFHTKLRSLLSSVALTLLSFYKLLF